MALVVTDDKHYKNIAGRIREVLKTDETFKSSQLLPKMNDALIQEGISNYELGLATGANDGKQAEWSAFWDNFQSNGNRTEYRSAFTREGWNDTTFKPKYDIQPTSATGMFYYSEIRDLRGILESQGVTLDLSKVADFANFFQASLIQYIGTVDVTGATATIGSICQNCYDLKEISELVVKEGNVFGASAFLNCSSLYHIRINGVLGSSVSFASSPLKKESIVNAEGTGIFNCMSDTVSGKTLTLKKTAVQKTFETAEGANDGNTSEEWLNLVASKSNWTITLA